jgi:hypothetical protein
MRLHALHSRRVVIIIFTLAVHGLLLWLALQVRTRSNPSEELPQFVSVWLFGARVLPSPTDIQPTLPILPQEPASPPNLLPNPPTPLPTMETQITLPILPKRPASPPDPSQNSIAVDTPVDWANEAALAARRYGEAANSDGVGGFSSAPKGTRKPCAPKKSSFEWHPEEKRVGFSGLLPYVLLGDRCVLGLGFFGCTLGELPEPTSHLLDDMKEQPRQESSVPTPEYCD